MKNQTKKQPVLTPLHREKRSHLLQVRCTESEMQLFQKRADKLTNGNLSDLARYMLGLGQPRPQDMPARRKSAS